MVLLLIPLVSGLVTVASALPGIIWLWCFATGETFKQGRRKRRPVPSIPVFYGPRWGAPRRGSAARERAHWVADFAMAEPV